MPEIEQDADEKTYGLSKLQTALLESRLKQYAETKPHMENTILALAQEVGLENVVARIKRLRRYARSRAKR